MKEAIIDLHCDLLCYLANDSSRSALDQTVPCSIPHLKEGGVSLQVLAVFTQTGKDSLRQADRQIELMKQLPVSFPGEVSIVSGKHDIKNKSIGLAYAFENASGFCEESEELLFALKRLEHFMDNFQRPLYISLTWNEENRFGGGNLTKVGLKSDGKRLLNFMHGRKIAVDISHTSDALAVDILNHIDNEGLEIPVIASHSNYRAVCNQPRNLPDELVKEIVRREGIIGLNFVRPFVSDTAVPQFEKHISHALDLGCMSHLCFGADFFFSDDIESTFDVPHFFEEYHSAATYPKILDMMVKDMGFTPEQVKNVASGNFLRFTLSVLT